jgi:hypothetical protein
MHAGEQVNEVHRSLHSGALSPVSENEKSDRENGRMRERSGQAREHIVTTVGKYRRLDN